MAIERRLVVGLNDIQAVVFECVKCRGGMVLSPDRTITEDKLVQCPLCGEQWLPNRNVAAEVLAFLVSLKSIRSQQAKPAFMTRLQFDGAALALRTHRKA
jgi:hypothetical protein